MVPVPSSRQEGHFQARFSLPVQRWLGSIQVAPKWHPSGIQVASKWHPSVRAHAEEDAEAAREFGMVVACIEVAAIPGLVVEDVLLERLGVAGVTDVTGVAGEESADALLVLLGDAEDGVVKACNDGCQWCQ